ncbi:MAG: HAMP domain-containing protein [Candidatus Omnitrophica bacterium]|nr:HAMP domain-containing protein [Candidatus Omnitrophota bacterium]
MMKGRIRYSLKQRIITLMVVFSIIFISSFCAIQVRNQLSTTMVFNAYKAKLSAFIIKNNLETTINENMLKSQDALTPLLQGALLSLKRSNVIENVLLYNKKSEILITSGVPLEYMKVTPADYRAIREFSAGQQGEKWLTTNIDPKSGTVSLYIPLLFSNGEFDYIAKAIFSLGNIEEALKQVYAPIIITVIIVILANIMLGAILTRTIVKPINVLNSATKSIVHGNLKRQVDIRTRDEIEELGDTFNRMSDSLQKMKGRAENANPLTKLPGNNVIHEEIKKRISANRKFVVVYSDLDNFKAFNDKYGIGAGDKAIQLTADLMRESLKLGTAEGFLGHEGGDDFVLLTTPNNAPKITKYIIEEFDKRVRELYNKKDLEQGYIMAHSRDGDIKKFPIMALSLAGVSNEKRALTSYGEITNICAEVKKKAKAVPQSIFVLDERVD